ncbi:MAG TPA: SPOR domain-containing protein [Bacteroidales bacterium]|nr:SPOR domain-containing protein [Bacteroidales bacterium]
MKKYIVMLLLLAFTSGFAQQQVSVKSAKPIVPAGFCVSSDALILYNMINDFRRSNKLPVIPLSKSLCYVAIVHITDLQVSGMVENGCGLHSWSDKGVWKACCYSKDAGRVSCMNNKPKELTGYLGAGYEIAFWDEERATPLGAMELWRTTDVVQNMLLNHDKWQSKQWKAMGVAIKGGFAIVWLGDKADTPQDMAICDTDSLVIKGKTPATAVSSSNAAGPANKPVTEKVSTVDKKKAAPAGEKAANTPANPDKPGDKFYLVIASMRDENAAKDEVQRLQNKGFTEAAIQKGENLFRITLGVYSSRDDAARRRDELANEFKGIWILRQ